MTAMFGVSPPHLVRTVVMVLSIMLQAALYSAISKTSMHLINNNLTKLS